MAPAPSVDLGGQFHYCSDLSLRTRRSPPDRDADEHNYREKFIVDLICSKAAPSLMGAGDRSDGKIYLPSEAEKSANVTVCKGIMRSISKKLKNI
jgi:hypothetical protein